MKVDRLSFLSTLKSILCATTKIEVLEQSNCFIFRNGSIMAFNGAVFARCKSNIPVDKSEVWGEFAVIASDLIGVLSKMPDERIDLSFKKDQLILTGNKKRAGLIIQKEILLPIADVIQIPDKMKKTHDVLPSMKMAARICKPGDDNYRVGYVLVSPDSIISTDYYRLLKISTSVPNIKKPTLIPASSLLSISDIKVSHLRLYQEWLFLRDEEKDVLLAICCGEGDYFEMETIDNILSMDDACGIELPEEMKDAVSRAMVMAGDDADGEASISLTSNSLIIRTRKSSGWYEEKQKIRFRGEPMKMSVDLQLLKDVLSKTLKAKIGNQKIKMQKDGIEFVASLEK